MPGPITFSIALKAAAPHLRNAAPWLWRHIPRNTAVGKAISATSEKYSTRLPSFGKSLEGWIQSEAFQAQVDGLEHGASVESETRHAEQFVSVTGFGLTAYGLDLVAEALLFFYGELYQELCEGEHGMRVVGAKLAAVHEEVILLRRDRSGSNVERLPFRPRVEGDSKTESAAEADRQTEAELNLIKSLVDKRKARTALGLLATLQERANSGKMSLALRFRFYLNKGVCHLLLGELDEAEQEFIRAQALDPVNRKTLINLAQIAISMHRFDVALRETARLLAQDPKDTVGQNFSLICLYDLGRNDEIAQVLGAHPALVDDPQCQYTLAYIASDRGDFDEAEHYLRRHIATSNGCRGSLGVARADYRYPCPAFTKDVCGVGRMDS